MELGGNITLVGFSERDFAELIVTKKVVGQYARKLNDSVEGFSHLTLTLKSVGNKQVEMHVKAEVSGKVFTSEMTGHNLFIVLDAVLKKIVTQVS